MADEKFNKGGDLDLRYKKSLKVQAVISEISKIQEGMLQNSQALATAVDSRVNKLSREEALQKQILANVQAERDIVNQITMAKDQAFQTDVVKGELLKNTLSSNQAILDANTKRKVISDATYQTQLLAQEKIEGIAETEEEILKLLRKKKLMEDPAFLAKKKELDILQKKQEYEETSNENIDKLKKIWTDAHALATDPKIALTVFSGVMMNNALKFAGTMNEVGTDMGLSRDQALEMGAALGPASIKAFAMGISAKSIGEAYSGIAESMGPMTGDMADMADNAAKFAKEMRIAPKDAGKLFALTHMIEGGTAETAEASLEVVANLARGAKVPIGKVMADVAGSADLLALYSYDSVEALGKAAVEAAKMGTSLDQMAKTADKLMDLDSARNDAMQLSVLLGREVNVSKAQQLIYEGKLDEGYKEMLRQLGGIQGFNQMDYYQKKKAAELMNTTVGDLQKQLNLQAGLTETGEKQAEGWAKIVGKAGDLGKFAADNMTTLASTLSVLGSIKNMKIITWAKEKAHMIWKKAFGGGGAAAAAGPMKADGTPDMRFKANKNLVSKIKKPVAEGEKMGGKLSKVKGTGKEGNVISRFFKSFNNVKWSSVFKAVVGMTLMGVALLAFVPGFMMLAQVPAKGIIAGIGTLLAMTLAMQVMGKATGSIIQGSVGLLIMGVALIPAAYAFGLIAEVPAAAMWNFAAVLVVLGLAFALLGMLGTLPVGALGLLIMAPAMIMAALAFQMVAGLPMGEMWNFAAVLTVLGLAFAGIGFLPTIFVGALGLLVLAAAMIPAALAFQMIKGIPMDEMWNFAGVLGALGLAFAGLGFLSPFIFAGALAMLVASGAMIAFGFAMKLIPADLMQGEQMMMMAAGMGAMGIAGISMLFGAPGFFAMSLGLIAFAGALLLIKPLLPVIEKLAQLGIIGDMEGAGGAKGEGGEGGGEENLIAEKLDEMISILKKGGKVIIDGKVAGKVVNMAAGPVGT